MSRLVELIGVTHNPFLPRLLQTAASDPVLAAIAEDYADMRRRMAHARPDVLVVISNDHLNQWFTDNMPAFLVGKAPEASGPFPHEMRLFGLPPYRAAVDMDLAGSFVREGFRAGVDFAFSDEFRLDHAFTVPLTFIRPEMDIPIVPIWANVMAPPLPPAERFLAVGQALRKLIEWDPGDKRVGIVCSGHLSVEVGGPKPPTRPSDPEFDRRMMQLIGEGDVKAIVAEATVERLMRAGNVAAGFLVYVLMLGIVGGRPPTSIGVRHPAATTAVPYMSWTLDPGAGA